MISDGKIAFLAEDNPNVRAYRRYLGEEDRIVLNNLRDETISVNLKNVRNRYEKLLDNYTGDNQAGTEKESRITEKAGEILLRLLRLSGIQD